MQPVPASEVPEVLIDRIASSFIDNAVGLPYGPYLSCQGYEGTAMQACNEELEDGGALWTADVAIKCTKGEWAKDLDHIIVHGQAAVDTDGNITIPAPAALGVELIVSKRGEGARPEAGRNVTVNYSLHYTNSTLIEDTYSDGAQPFTFTVGVGQVIRAWDEGIQLLRVGGSATLIARSSFAYGPAGAGADVIPGNATLVFEIDVLSEGKA
ncbi:hypothetical protein ABPG75_008920 [Micractinium tetrahymenae]